MHTKVRGESGDCLLRDGPGHPEEGSHLPPQAPRRHRQGRFGEKMSFTHSKIYIRCQTLFSQLGTPGIGHVWARTLALIKGLKTDSCFYSWESNCGCKLSHFKLSNEYIHSHLDCKLSFYIIIFSPLMRKVSFGEVMWHAPNNPRWSKIVNSAVDFKAVLFSTAS